MKKTGYVFIFLLIIIGVYGVIKFSKNDFTLNQNINSDGEELVEIEKVIPGEVKKVDEETNTFIHKKYGFSLNFPNSMTSSNFLEGAGEQIQFQGNNGDWFQIYITPWNEGEDISIERIREDLPDMVISSPQQVIIGPHQKDGIGPKALIFFSKDSGLGDTREVWFAQNGYLYQITTYKRLDPLIGEVLATFQYQ